MPQPCAHAGSLWSRFMLASKHTAGLSDHEGRGSCTCASGQRAIDAACLLSAHAWMAPWPLYAAERAADASCALALNAVREVQVPAYLCAAADGTLPHKRLGVAVRQ